MSTPPSSTATGRTTPDRNQSTRLSTDGIAVRFDGVVALEDVTLSVARGEILGLIGPNGAGKTTLLNVLSGFQKPTEGHVSIDDAPVTDKGPQWRVRNGIARSFQSVRLFSSMTVFENVELGALSVGASRRAARGITWDVLEALDLADLADQSAGAISHGTERIVGMARCLTSEPSIVLLDEPAAGLNDTETRRLEMVLLDIPQRFGCGVLIIEHDLPLIMSVCDRIHVLNFGRTITSGTPDEVRTHPDVIAAYIGG